MKVKTSGDYVVPGFNEYAKELHTEARSCFIAWKSLEKPRAGLCYTGMCQSRLRFKSVLKHCKRNEDSLRANALAKSYTPKDSYSFWKDINHVDDAKILLASKINDCVGDTDIIDLVRPLPISIEQHQLLIYLVLLKTNLLKLDPFIL